MSHKAKVVFWFAALAAAFPFARAVSPKLGLQLSTDRLSREVAAVFSLDMVSEDNLKKNRNRNIVLKVFDELAGSRSDR